MKKSQAFWVNSASEYLQTEVPSHFYQRWFGNSKFAGEL